MIALVLLRFCDWPKYLVLLFKLIGSKTKTKCVNCSHLFCADSLILIASSSDWFIALYVSVVISQSNYFGFSFMTLK